MGHMVSHEGSKRWMMASGEHTEPCWKLDWLAVMGKHREKGSQDLLLKLLVDGAVLY